jgi:O-antigen/teichoic acid export membrane protein
MSNPLKSKRILNLIKNSGILFFSSKIQTLVVFIQSIVVARSLGISNYGKWAIVVAVCGFILNFSTLRTGDVLGKFLVELKQKKKFLELQSILKKTLLLDFSTYLLAICLVPVISFWAGPLLKGPGNISVYFIYGSSLFLDFVDSTWFCLERDNYNYKAIGILSFTNVFIRVFLIIFFFIGLRKVDLFFLSIAYLISSGLVFLVKLFRVKKLLLNYDKTSLLKLIIIKTDSKHKSSPYLKEYWQFIRVSYFSTFFTSIIKKMDILAVGYFFSSDSVGFLRLAKNISRSIEDLTSSLVKPIYQEFNELIAMNKHKRIFVFLRRNFKYYFGILIIIILFPLLFIEPFIKIVYGTEFLPASSYFKIYLLFVFINLAGFWINPLILALKGWNFRLKILIFSIPFLFITVIGFRYLWQVIGIIIACILTRLLLLFASWLYIMKNLKTKTVK